MRVLCLCGLLGAGCSLTIYPPAPGDEVDATAHLSIDGRELPLVVEPGSGKRCDGHPALPSSRARFASDGAARKDAGFGPNFARARNAGLQVGAAHRFDPCAVADGQSGNFVTMVPRDAELLPPAILLETTADDCPTQLVRTRICHTPLADVDRQSLVPDRSGTGAVTLGRGQALRIV